MSQTALLVIDLQNDYFPNGKFPLWNTELVLNNVKTLINHANKQQMPILLVQHISSAPKGKAPFFEQGSEGVDIHSDILAICTNAKIIQKKFADSFHETNLSSVLSELAIDELLICGMMTQNCVTHTAMSKQAENYKVSVIQDCCTTTDQMIHNIALNAVGVHIPLVDLAELL